MEVGVLAEGVGSGFVGVVGAGSAGVYGAPVGDYFYGLFAPGMDDCRRVLQAIGSGAARLVCEIRAVGGLEQSYAGVLRVLVERGLIRLPRKRCLFRAKPYELTRDGAKLYWRLTGERPVEPAAGVWDPHGRVVGAVRRAYPGFRKVKGRVWLDGVVARLDLVLHSGPAWVAAEVETGSNDRAWLMRNLRKLKLMRGEIVKRHPEAVVTLLWAGTSQAVKERLEALASDGVVVRTLHELEGG